MTTRQKASILCLAAVSVSARATILPTTPAGVHCAATAEGAVAKLLAAEDKRQGELNDVLAQNASAGFRVVAVRFDPVAQRRWAMVSNCAEPSRPLRSIALPRSANGLPQSLGVSAPMLVHTGDAVTVIRESGSSHLELQGTAVESGALRGEVHVRMPSFSNEPGSVGPVLRCTVVSAGVVEVQQ
jgi:hypothetical protein